MKEKKIISDELLNEFGRNLMQDEKSAATIEKYLHDVRIFAEFAGKRYGSIGENSEPQTISRQMVLEYKQYLCEKYAASSANSMLAALNAFFRFAGRHDCCVKQFKTQRQVYCPEEKELTREEYFRLVKAAGAKNNRRLQMIMETICSTGIRISELQFITVEAIDQGEAIVRCKGKYRRIFIVKALKCKLKAYVKSCGITEGPVFRSRSGRVLDRSNIWREMKALCRRAGVQESKVFPHNLRHLFARVFYAAEKDIAKLADILGHTSINTTRIYMTTTGAEHRRRMEALHLVL